MYNNDLRTAEEEAMAKKLAEKKAARRNKKDEDNPLAITSLMDALTIILIFLLKSYGSDPMSVPQKKNELMIPKSTSMSNMVECVDIQISRTSIVVKGKKVVTINNLGISSQDAPNGYIIKNLKDRLDDLRNKEIEAKQISAKKFQGEAFIAADTKIPWKLVDQVLKTAVRARYLRFSFAIVKTRGG
ncbi:MAG: biopolymer transporter ExbD [Deltaproteobacteria bacterium]|jgi:biopolymer transport protein ExbD|nr:biopolymer transporter ExbD [Deltaproteobacteria bacterium]